jgi:transcriptional regulator with XRE-family HTH domain
MPIKDNIKRIRLLRSLSVQQLADKMSIGKQSIYDWEAGKYEPGPENLDELAKALDVKKMELFEENPTSAMKSTDNKEITPDSLIKEIHPDYFVVPKTIIQGDYRLELVTQMESKERLMQKALDTQDALIIELRKEISDLRTRLKVEPAERTQ